MDQGWCSPDTVLTGADNCFQYWGAAYPERSKLGVYASPPFNTSGQDFTLQYPSSALNQTAYQQAFTHPNMSFVAQDFTLPSANRHPMFYVAVFAAIKIGGGLIRLLILVVQYTAAFKASKEMFKKLLDSVVHATMRWFDTTPQGRPLNRFSNVCGCIASSASPNLSRLLRTSKR